ncbi:MAG: SDR family NAD(P)-dependent oxidoreductase [Nitrospiraceae bacterium]|nr:SDR family NAD(P)-dependent oxidoreductase [Nitrospiraceae bacterium]
MTSIRFLQQDLILFSAASHDRNPLHLSEGYARSTPYAEPVVFGVLGFLAALGQLPDQDSHRLHALSVEFRNPLVMGAEYRIETACTSSARWTIRLYDAGRIMMKATVTFEPGAHKHLPLTAFSWQGPCEAADRTRSDCKAGTSATGTYGPAIENLEQVIDRWNLSSKGASVGQLAALLWASFVVGMELPGRRAVFWRLALTFASGEEQGPGPWNYRVAVTDFDDRLDMVHMNGTLFWSGLPCVEARMSAFVRQDSPRASPAIIRNLLPRSRQLEGKVAVVIGGSRGLGAAISQTLASQGCSVLVAYQQSGSEAEQVRAACRNESGAIELVQGDAGDVQWCQDLRRRVMSQYGGLDILVCNASPPIRPLAFISEKIPQFQEFVHRSLEMVSTPLSALLEALSEKSGWNIAVSSAFVADLPVEWPHYIAAKSAIEGLVHWASVHYPLVQGVIVRPPRLLTDQTNTALGRQGAMRVEGVAVGIVRSLSAPRLTKAPHILERFDL